MEISLQLRNLRKVAGMTAGQHPLNKHSRLGGVREICCQTLYLKPSQPINLEFSLSQELLTFSGFALLI